MDRQPVTSESLTEVGYDPEYEILEVMFRHGGIYQYRNFPAHMFERFMSADSLGRFLNLEIKKHFPEERI